MGLRIAIPGANFTYYTDRISYPVMEGLSSLYFLGGDETESVKNRVPGVEVVGTVGGSITYDDHYAIFAGESYTNYIQVPELDNVADMTLISVHRMPNAAGVAPAGRPIMSIWGGPTSSDNLLHDGVLAVTAGVGNVYPKYTGASGAYSQPDFHFRAGVVEGADVTAYQVVAGAVAVGQTLSIARGTSSSHNYRIGGRYATSTGYSDTAYIALIAKHAVPLSLVQLQEIYDFVKAYYGRRGLTVL